MALTSAYLVSVKNVNDFLDSLISAKAPDAFTQKFIEGLGFKSTNDRLFISVLKGLGFLDSNAVPTEIYFKFLDQSESKRVLAVAIEDAYGDLFAVKKDAQDLPVADVKNKLKTLTQGKYSDKVVSLMASTFKALSDYADWTKKTPITVFDKSAKTEDKSKVQDSQKILKPEVNIDNDSNQSSALKQPDFHYNIQIHLPDSRDEAVYDAIFKSLRKHIF
jgi:hypothetical protein